jgi:nucleotide-binding universal stress UspA family protein
MTGILVPLDESALADRILPLAATLARATNSQLRLVKAISLPPAEEYIGSMLDELEAGARDYLADKSEELQDAYGLVVTTAVQYGPAADVILRHAATDDIGYVAMTTHARHGVSRAVLGSIAEHVVRESPVPVYLLPAAAHERDFSVVKHIMLPVDGSPLSESVVAPIARLAQLLAADVTLFRVYEDGAEAAGSALTKHVEKFRELGVEVKDMTVVGQEAAHRIIELAGVVEADMIAMATHGRSGLDRLAHGSVTEEVLRHSHLPLLTFGRLALQKMTDEGAAVPTEAAV